MTPFIPAPRTAYDDLPATEDLCTDCDAASRRLALTSTEHDPASPARPAPSLRFEEHPHHGVLSAAHSVARSLDLA